MLAAPSWRETKHPRLPHQWSFRGWLQVTRSYEVVAQNFAGIYELRVLESYDKFITEQEKPEAVCEFCKMQYMLTREELQELIERLDHL